MESIPVDRMLSPVGNDVNTESNRKLMELVPLQGLPNFYGVVPRKTRPIWHCPEFFRHMTQREKRSFMNQLSRIQPQLVLDVPVRKDFVMPKRKPKPKVLLLVKPKVQAAKIVESNIAEEKLAEKMPVAIDDGYFSKDSDAAVLQEQNCRIPIPNEKIEEEVDNDASTAHQKGPNRSGCAPNMPKRKRGRKPKSLCEPQPLRRIPADLMKTVRPHQQILPKPDVFQRNGQLHRYNVNPGASIRNQPTRSYPAIREALERKVPGVAEAVAEAEARSRISTVTPMFEEKKEPIKEQRVPELHNTEPIASLQRTESNDEFCEILDESSNEGSDHDEEDILKSLDISCQNHLIEARKRNKKAATKIFAITSDTFSTKCVNSLIVKTMKEMETEKKTEKILKNHDELSEANQSMTSTPYSILEAETTMEHEQMKGPISCAEKSEFDMKCDKMREAFRRKEMNREESVMMITNILGKIEPAELAQFRVVFESEMATLPFIEQESEIKQPKSDSIDNKLELQLENAVDMTNVKVEIDGIKTEFPLTESPKKHKRRIKKDKKTRKPSFSIAFMKYMAQYLSKISLKNRLARFLRRKLKVERQNQIDETINCSDSMENPEETQKEKQLYVFSIKKENLLIKQMLELKSQIFTNHPDAKYSPKVKNELKTVLNKLIHQKQQKVARVEIGKRIFQIKNLPRNGKKKTKRRRLIKELKEMCQKWPATSLFPKLNYHAVMMENKRRAKIDKQPLLRNIFVKIAEVKKLEQENNILKSTTDSKISTSYAKYLNDKDIKARIPINSWKRLIEFNMKRLLITTEANPYLSRQLNEISHLNTSTNMKLTKIESQERIKRMYYSSLMNLNIKRNMCKNNSYNRQFKRLIHDEGKALKLLPITPVFHHYVYINERLKFVKMVNNSLCFIAAAGEEKGRISSNLGNLSEVSQYDLEMNQIHFSQALSDPEITQKPHVQDTYDMLPVTDPVQKSQEKERIRHASKKEIGRLSADRAKQLTRQTTITEPGASSSNANAVDAKDNMSINSNVDSADFGFDSRPGTTSPSSLISNEGLFPTQIQYIPKERVPITRQLRQTGRRFRSEFRDTQRQANAVLDILRNFNEEKKKIVEQGLAEEPSKRKRGKKLSTLLGGTPQKEKRARRTKKVKLDEATNTLDSSKTSDVITCDLRVETSTNNEPEINSKETPEKHKSNLQSTAKLPPTRSCDNIPGFLTIGIARPSTATLRTNIAESKSTMIPSHPLIGHNGEAMAPNKHIIGSRLSETYKNVPHVEGAHHYDPKKEIKTSPAKSFASPLAELTQSGTKAEIETSSMNAIHTSMGTLCEPSVTDLTTLSDDRNEEAQEQQLPQTEAAHDGQVQRKKRYVTPYAKRKPKKRVRILNSDEEEDSDDDFRLPGHYKRKKSNQSDSSEDTTLRNKKQADRIRIKEEPVDEGADCPFIRRSGRLHKKNLRYQDDDEILIEKQMKQEVKSPEKAAEKKLSIQATDSVETIESAGRMKKSTRLSAMEEVEQNQPSCSYNPRKVKPELLEHDDDVANSIFGAQTKEIQDQRHVEPKFRSPKVEPLTPKKYNCAAIEVPFELLQLPSLGVPLSSPLRSSGFSTPLYSTNNTAELEVSLETHNETLGRRTRAPKRKTRRSIKKENLNTPIKTRKINSSPSKMFEKPQVLEILRNLDIERLSQKELKEDSMANFIMIMNEAISPHKLRELSAHTVEVPRNYEVVELAEGQKMNSSSPSLAEIRQSNKEEKNKASLEKNASYNEVLNLSLTSNAMETNIAPAHHQAIAEEEDETNSQGVMVGRNFSNIRNPIIIDEDEYNTKPMFNALYTEKDSESWQNAEMRSTRNYSAPSPDRGSMGDSPKSDYIASSPEYIAIDYLNETNESDVIGPNGVRELLSRSNIDSTKFSSSWNIDLPSTSRFAPNKEIKQEIVESTSIVNHAEIQPSTSVSERDFTSQYEAPLNLSLTSPSENKKNTVVRSPIIYDYPKHVSLWTIEETARWMAVTCPQHSALKDFISNELINGLALVQMTKFDLEKHFDNQNMRFGDKCNFYAIYRDLMLQYGIKTWD